MAHQRLKKGFIRDPSGLKKKFTTLSRRLIDSMMDSTVRRCKHHH